MADDIMIYAVIAFLVIAPGIFLAAKLSDIRWRVRMQRKYQKKDYHIAYLISKDRRASQPKVFLPEDSMIWSGEVGWSVLHNRIYREDKPDEGFEIQPKHIRDVEQIPTLFLSEDTMRPVDFHWGDNTNARPGEAGAIMKSWVVNQLAKALAIVKKQEVFLMIIMGLCVLILVGLYMTYQRVDDVFKAVADIKADTNITRAVVAPQTMGNVTSTTIQGGVMKVGG